MHIAFRPDGILEETRKTLSAGLENYLETLTVERVVIGLFFTGVKLNNGKGGLCFTPIKTIPKQFAASESLLQTGIQREGPRGYEIFRHAPYKAGENRSALPLFSMSKPMTTNHSVAFSVELLNVLRTLSQRPLIRSL